MRSLLLFAILSAVLVGSHAWPSWGDFKAKLQEAKDKMKEGYGEHVDPLFNNVKESWDESVQPFFDKVGQRAKNFVSGHKDKFSEFAEKIEDFSEAMKKCRECSEKEDCKTEENEMCEEEYGIFSQIFEFYDCLKAPEMRECIKEMQEKTKSGEKEERRENLDSEATAKRSLEHSKEMTELQLRGLLKALLSKAKN